MNPISNENIDNTPTATTENTERRSSDWDIKNAPKNYLSLIITQGGSSVFAFLSVLLITKVLGSEGYGGIVAIIAASQIAQVLVNWTSFSLIRFGAEEFIETEKISRIFWFRLFIFIPNILLVIVASRLWFPPLATWLKLSSETFYFVLLHFIATALWIHVQFSLQGIKKQRLQGVLLLGERLLVFFGLLTLFFFGRLTAHSSILFYACSPLLMAFVGIWYLRKYIFVRFTMDVKFLRAVLLYSIPLLPFSLVGYFSGSYVDAVFISKFLSTKDLGVYSVATQINGMALQIPTLANSLLIPFFVTLQKEKRSGLLTKYFQHTFPTLTLVGGILCSLMAFISYFLIPLIFGAEFFESVLPLWILLSASVTALPAMLGFAALTNSTSATYIATFAAITSAITNIMANFLLIPRYGMKGCAWATVITFFISTLTYASFLVRKEKIAVSWVFLAILPSLFGAVCFTVTENSWMSLLVSFIFTIVIVYFKKDSLIESLKIINKIRSA